MASARRSRGVRLLRAAGAALVLLALAHAYGAEAVLVARDLWGPDFSYYDNGRTVTVKLHRLPGPGSPGQARLEAGWPEAVLRAASCHTLNLMGLSGPEGRLWTARMVGDVLVVTARAGGAEVGRYRVTEGSPDSGLAVVELEAGPNGLHLMEVVQPHPGGGWFVVEVHTVIGVSPPGGS